MTWLDDVKARCEAATAGPLSIYKTIPFDPECRRYMVYPQPPEGGSVEHVAFDVNGIENAVFIASAVDDLPRCIAWIERLRDRLQQVVDSAHTIPDPAHPHGNFYRHSVGPLAISEAKQALSELEQA